MNIAIILAGGSGSSLGGSMPKQFLKIAGKTIIEHTIDVFEQSDLIDEICVVSKDEFFPEIEQIVVMNQYCKVKRILQAGKQRYLSSMSAIAAYDCDDDNLFFHDAVRPLVNERIIRDCVEALKTYRAVDVATPTTDTIIQVDEHNCISQIPLRSELRNGQTPQCFKRGVIRKAYELAMQDPGFTTTDDCGVVRKYLPEEPVYVVKGETSNMKLTYMEDLFLVDKLFQLRNTTNTKEVMDIARKKMPGKVMVVFGGSMGIGEETVKLGRELGAVACSFSRSQNDVDVTDVEKVREALRQVYEQYGHIDYVVCTPGILVRESLADISYEDIVYSINVNYMGVVTVAKESFPYLCETEGSIIFYTSSSYTRGRKFYSIYSSTKTAIVNLVQALSEEWFGFGVRVNCVNPERTRTPMRLNSFGVEPEGSLLEPRFVAVATINTLVSDYSGRIIDVKR
jgi:2-C-methyl-D-erythritol 4-phosphate cytidylyltransferase